MQSIYWVALLTGAFFILRRIFAFRNAIRAINDHPGQRVLMTSYGLLGLVYGKPIPGVTVGLYRQWTRKYDDFALYGADIHSTVTFQSTHIELEVADPAVIKELTTSRARFPKPVKFYSALSFFGPNIIVSEGDEWKRYRKIAAPAFSERNNKLVWDETVQIMTDLFDDVWKGKSSITTDHAVDITLPIALSVIAVAGFGRRLSWDEDSSTPPGHRISFKEALHSVSTDVYIKAFAPAWLLNLGLTERMRRVNLGFAELESYMMQMIQERRESDAKVERYDLFSSLLDASDESDGLSKLADREVLGNIFIFLLAGHETTAHTLCFAFALLALYPDIQEKLYQHIQSVLLDGRVPSYGDMNSFTYSMAVFNETLRMFPPVVGVPKSAAEDTTLVTINSAGERIVVPVPQGAIIGIHVAGVHYNARYWPNPEEFIPERFLGDWPRDAFLPFSAGARACLGRRFFETEAIAALTMLVSRFKIEVKEEPQYASETHEQRKHRILAGKMGLSLTPVKVPLVFTRR